MRHIIPISGKDSLATAIWQGAHRPELPYEYAFNDTRAELPETYQWLDRVEKTLGISIVRIGKSLAQIIEEEGILPSPKTRFCTRLAKIKPMDAFIGNEQATVYFGLRADEPERAGALETKRVFPRYPLREAGIGLATVYRIVETRELMPPSFFWERLFKEVVDRTGGIEGIGLQIINEWPQWMRDRIFAWRSRPNCYFCFFQRRYEWIGLLEHHPDLFDAAERMEETVGNGENMRRDEHFSWIDGFPLRQLRVRAAEIFEKRVKAVCKLVRDKQQGDWYADSIDEMELAQTSCGLLCGK
jgi:hypothetical protein